MNRYQFLKDFAINWLITRSGISGKDTIEEYGLELSELSVAHICSLLPDYVQDELFRDWTEVEWNEVEYDWHFWARQKQIPPPGSWSIWLLMTGRGFGKTRTGASWIVEKAQSLDRARIGLVGESTLDVHDVMILGESGILSLSPPHFTPEYVPSKRRLTWPNKTVGITYAGSKPDLLRGPNHHWVWLDELTKYRYPDDVWDNMEMGLRLGPLPQALTTTTPKNIQIVRDLIEDHEIDDSDVKITYGTTFENRSNLSPKFIKRVVKRYGGTRLGMQELYAQVLEDDPNALWNRDLIDQTRVKRVPEFTKVVIGVDPPAGVTECGIIVAGLGTDNNAYILDDVSIAAKPATWGGRVAKSFNEWTANEVVAEKNNGGDMVEHTLQTAMYKKNGVYRPAGASIPVKLVYASRSKRTRAEPVSVLYERGWVHHAGTFADLEDELCTWVPGDASPNRLDALVWSIWALMIDGEDIAQVEWMAKNPLYS